MIHGVLDFTNSIARNYINLKLQTSSILIWCSFHMSRYQSLYKAAKKQNGTHSPWCLV